MTTQLQSGRTTPLHHDNDDVARMVNARPATPATVKVYDTLRTTNTTPVATRTAPPAITWIVSASPC